jgi:hypothetical protein
MAHPHNLSTMISGSVPQMSFGRPAWPEHLGAELCQLAEHNLGVQMLKFDRGFPPRARDPGRSSDTFWLSAVHIGVIIP